MHHVHDKVCREQQQGGEREVQLLRRDWSLKLSREDADSAAVLPHSVTHAAQKRPVVPAVGQHLQRTGSQ